MPLVISCDLNKSPDFTRRSTRSTWPHKNFFALFRNDTCIQNTKAKELDHYHFKTVPADTNGTLAGLSRAPLVFRIDGVVLAAPSDGQLFATRADRGTAGVKPPRAKTRPGGTVLVRAPHMAAARGTDQRRTLRGRQRAWHPVAAVASATTSLLATSPTGGVAVAPLQFDTVLHDLLVLGIGPGCAECYSAHSGRIGRACRMFAAGAPRVQIQALYR